MDPRTKKDLPQMRTWLHFACMKNAMKVVEKLIKAGANVHAQDKVNGHTIFFIREYQTDLIYLFYHGVSHLCLS